MQINYEDLSLANIPGVHEDFARALEDVLRDFAEPDRFEKSKGQIAGQISIVLDLVTDTDTGVAHMKTQVKVKRPKPASTTRAVTIRSGKVWVEPEHPDQAPLPFTKPSGPSPVE